MTMIMAVAMVITTFTDQGERALSMFTRLLTERAAVAMVTVQMVKVAAALQACPNGRYAYVLKTMVAVRKEHVGTAVLVRTAPMSPWWQTTWERHGSPRLAAVDTRRTRGILWVSLTAKGRRDAMAMAMLIALILTLVTALPAVVAMVTVGVVMGMAESQTSKFCRERGLNRPMDAVRKESARRSMPTAPTTSCGPNMWLW
mmetsp:Transcript_4621/g.16556  ORF Transcript_4621/g.16556 Transcript_4621/m.16556 type:complete len:201 (-) Transcript_4621:257-859(-)